MFLVSKSMTFDAAHFLPNYPGKCAEIHGHRWKVILTLSVEKKSENGISIDFGILKSMLTDWTNGYDHTLLNKTITKPTAENLLLDLREFVLECLTVLRSNDKIHSLTLYETPTSWITLKGDENASQTQS